MGQFFAACSTPHLDLSIAHPEAGDDVPRVSGVTQDEGRGVSHHIGQVGHRGVDQILGGHSNNGSMQFVWAAIEKFSSGECNENSNEDDTHLSHMV
jgi:hypothetical protein